jgi:hypothetical protein
MKVLSRMLLASVLAIGAAAFGGCDDTADCPASFNGGAPCTSAGLTCFAGSASCTCTSGVWACNNDLPFPLPRDMTPRDLTPATD